MLAARASGWPRRWSAPGPEDVPYPILEGKMVAADWVSAVRRQGQSQPSKLVVLSSTLLSKGDPGPVDDEHLVPDDHGSCKGPPPDCRRIVIRLRCGVKGRCARRTTSTGRKCLVNVHP